MKFLCLGSKIIQIIIFILNALRGCSMRIQNTPRATQRESYWLMQGEANLIGCLPVWCFFFLLLRYHGGAKCCSMRILNVS